MVNAALRDAIYAILRADPIRSWPIDDLCGWVGLGPVPGQAGRSWGDLPDLRHSVRDEMAELLRSGVVTRVRPATYRLNGAPLGVTR